MVTRENLYRYHVDNVRAVDEGLNHIGRIMRHAVAVDSMDEIKTNVRMYALLLAVCGEARLNKLLHEPAFSDSERKYFRDIESHIDRWKTLVETAFRRRYNVPRATLNTTTLPHAEYARYMSLIGLLDSELKPIITLRNKLAHGQWVYPMTTDGQSVAQEQYDALRTENALSLELKRKLIISLLEAIHYLRVSEKTFQRDFDKISGRIEQLRQQLRNKSYETYATTMKERYAHGKILRKKVSS